MFEDRASILTCSGIKSFLTYTSIPVRLSKLFCTRDDMKGVGLRVYKWRFCNIPSVLTSEEPHACEQPYSSFLQQYRQQE